MIRLERLTKYYRTSRALAGVDLEVREGETFGVLGPNGAGKTTLFSILSGLLAPTSGRALVEGRDVRAETRAVRAMTGVVPQEFSAYEKLTCWENMALFGGLHGLKGADLSSRIRDLLGSVGLLRRAHDRVEEYSGGMKHRLNIVLGLVHDPRLVLLDEPTVGLDPLAREELWEVLARLKRGGKTVLLTTHYLEEAERLCDRIAILDEGRVKLVGDPRRLGQGLAEAYRSCVTKDSVAANRKEAPT